MADSRSWNWDNVTDRYWSEPAPDVYFLLHRWREQRFETLLDLGAGLGRHSLLFAAHGFRVTAVDSSSSGLARLEASARSAGLAITALRADLSALPLASGSCDAVLAYHSLYHATSAGMERAIAEVRRVVRPAGELYVTLISKLGASFRAADSEVIDANVRMKREEDGSLLPHFYCDADDVRRLLSGFELLSVRQIEDWYDGGKSSWHYFVHARRTA